MAMKVVEKGILFECESIADNLSCLKIFAPEIAAQALPGQFVTILPPPNLRSYLRRPFSIAGITGGLLHLLIKPVGEVTQALCHLPLNYPLELLGPIGNTYPEMKGSIWMLAGGSGVASLLFLAKIRRQQGLPVHLLWGGKAASHLPNPEKVDYIFTPATDDGSLGEAGTIGTVLSKWLQQQRPEAIFACGPRAMLIDVQAIASAEEIPTWLSVEEFMACGIGACSGCVVPLTNGGYSRTCVDGPIFRSEEIKL